MHEDMYTHLFIYFPFPLTPSAVYSSVFMISIILFHAKLFQWFWSWKVTENVSTFHMLQTWSESSILADRSFCNTELIFLLQWRHQTREWNMKNKLKVNMTSEIYRTLIPQKKYKETDLKCFPYLSFWTSFFSGIWKLLTMCKMKIKKNNIINSWHWILLLKQHVFQPVHMQMADVRSSCEHRGLYFVF